MERRTTQPKAENIPVGGDMDVNDGSGSEEKDDLGCHLILIRGLSTDRLHKDPK